MSEAGAALQSYNNELVNGIQGLMAKRKVLNEQIIVEEKEKESLEQEIKTLSIKLRDRKTSLEKKIEIRKEFDDTISNSQAMYMKILESSQSLVSVLKSGSKSLDEKLNKNTSPSKEQV